LRGEDTCSEEDEEGEFHGDGVSCRLAGHQMTGAAPG
jgi:hypothetical protein